jgi:hypothetical protein
MNTAQLISNAWYLSGIVPRALEGVSGEQGTDGLMLLNFLLSRQSMTGRYIPYFTYYMFDAVVAQEEYFIPGAVTLETCTFNIGVVRYQMNLENRSYYRGAPRVDNIQALPFDWYWETVVGGVNLYMYFLPQDVYQMKLSGKFALTQITDPSFVLDTVLDLFYQEYLMFLLAEYMCTWYKLTPSQDVLMKIKEFKDTLADRNYTDLTIAKATIYGSRGAVTYAQANLGKGWTSP